MRKLAALVVGAMSLVIVVGASGGPATGAGPNGLRRDGAHGVWFMRACGLPVAAHATCGAQVVTNSAGTPMVTNTAPPPGAYGPAEFHTAYNLPTSAPGSQTVGIVDAYDDPNIEADLAAYSAQYGLPSCTTANGCFRKINQVGGTTYPAANAGWSLEIALDVETAHEICQNCRILLVEATTASLANLGAAENEAVAMGATAISNSWGAFEYSTETTDESLYFNHPGVAITASTGDDGYGVQFPAASRYVTAVGGTTLNVNGDDTWQSETAWSGAGSGCSRYIPKPSWQTDSACARRTVADVSADADPNTGAAVYDTVAYSGETGWFQVGGTSLGSPLIAATYALTGTAASTDAGSTPYAHTGSLHDVTSGSNGYCGGTYLCTAKTGYDGPTGLGTPNGIAAFSTAQGPPPADFSVGVSPSSTTVTAGTTASYSVTVSTTGGFPGAVTLTQSGLANGTFTPGSVTGGGGSTLTVNTTGMPAGSYPFTIKGTSGPTVHSVPATLVVQAQAPPADFSVGVSPSSTTVTAGTTASYSVTVSTTGGFPGAVTLTQSGLANGTFTPGSVTGGGGSTLTVNTTGMPAGSYPFTIKGTSGATVHSVPATLVVQAAPPPAQGDFSISATPTSRYLFEPATTTFTVTITPTSGFNGQVSLSATGFVPGVTGSFAPNPGTSSSTFTVQVSGVKASRTGTRVTLTITGTSGSLAHSTTVTLIVI